jgi:hypothetical protein
MLLIHSLQNSIEIKQKFDNYGESKIELVSSSFETIKYQTPVIKYNKSRSRKEMTNINRTSSIVEKIKIITDTNTIHLMSK